LVPEIAKSGDDVAVNEFLTEWNAWRDAREEGLRAPSGWLAITGLHWLTLTPQRFDGVPGDWAGDEGGAAVSLGPDESVTVRGVSLSDGVHLLGPLDETGLMLSFGEGLVAQVADRDGQPIMRPRHPDAPNLRGYRGTPCYPPDPGWVLPARFEPYSSFDDAAVGEIVFAYDGSEHRLVAWGQGDGSLWILFRDATSGVTTHPANRQLLVDRPGPDGAVSIDFNRAINMPCAYTDFTTCPVPPAANTLSFAVEAGEQVPVSA
jgi:uncharacterized protein (DUF1684 family)